MNIPNDIIFEVGEVVWAKVWGFPAWPAIVIIFIIYCGIDCLNELKLITGWQ